MTLMCSDSWKLFYRPRQAILSSQGMSESHWKAFKMYLCLHPKLEDGVFCTAPQGFYITARHKRQPLRQFTRGVGGSHSSQAKKCLFTKPCGDSPTIIWNVKQKVKGIKYSRRIPRWQRVPKLWNSNLWKNSAISQMPFFEGRDSYVYK